MSDGEFQAGAIVDSNGLILSPSKSRVRYSSGALCQPDELDAKVCLSPGDLLQNLPLLSVTANGLSIANSLQALRKGNKPPDDPPPPPPNNEIVELLKEIVTNQKIGIKYLISIDEALEQLVAG